MRSSPDHPGITVFANDLDNGIKHRFGYKTQSLIAGLSDTANMSRVKGSLYLRLRTGQWEWFDERNVLVIASIGFQRQRAGHATWLLALLVSLAPKFGYTKIGIESVGKDPSIQNFVRKFGFDLMQREGVVSENWIISVVALQSKLAPQLKSDLCTSQ